MLKRLYLSADIRIPWDSSDEGTDCLGLPAEDATLGTLELGYSVFALGPGPAPEECLLACNKARVIIT